MAISIDAPRELRALVVPLRALVTKTFALQKRRAGEVTVVLTGDDALRRLNRQWRGIDKATDVLSFAYDEDEPDAATRPVTGDLVVSMDRVRVQSKRFRVTQGAELARLVIHGALHLCGHDHKAPGERKAMREREEKALAGAKAAIRKLDAGLKAKRP